MDFRLFVLIIFIVYICLDIFHRATLQFQAKTCFLVIRNRVPDTTNLGKNQVFFYRDMCLPWAYNLHLRYFIYVHGGTNMHFLP